MFGAVADIYSFWGIYDSYVDNTGINRGMITPMSINTDTPVAGPEIGMSCIVRSHQGVVRNYTAH
jgi:hypothetical protein